MSEKQTRYGFQGMDVDKRKRISSMGGKAAHTSGNAHQFTHEEAVVAGIKSGQSRVKKVRVEVVPDPIYPEQSELQ